MIPTSNNNNLGCNPISSNCVIWQGPDINCGNLVICNGDSVSDVVAKLAEELCDATYSVALNIDVKCLEGIADPTNLDEVVQALIDKVCETPEPTPRSGPDETLYPLPSCLVENGVVNVTVSDYVELLGAKVCSIINQITQLTNQLNALTDRVEILEGYFPLSNDEVEIVSECILKDQTVGVSTLVAAFEQEYCLFSAAVGSEALVRQAIAAQCINGNNNRLSGAGTFSGVADWQTGNLTLAQSHQNQWTVICDLYNAVTGILENCCGGGCDGVQFGFTYSITDNQSTGLPENLNVNFTSSVIPNGFSDCNGGTNVELTDSNGTSVTFAVDVTSQQNQGNGVNYNLSSSGLNLTSSLQIRVPFCVTNGTDTCSDVQTQSIPLSIPCPNNIQITSISSSEVRVQFNSVLPAPWTYQLRLLNNNSIVKTHVITSPGTGSVVDYTFSGLSAGVEYCVEVGINEGSISRSSNLRFDLADYSTSTNSIICQGGCVTTAGQSCTTGSIVTTSTSNYPLSSIFLGIHNAGSLFASQDAYYFDPLSNKIYINNLASSDVRLSGVSFYNYTAAVGSVTLELKANAGGTGGVNAIFYDYSLDNGKTYQGLTNIAVTNTTPQSVTINTGATSGSIYIRAYTNSSVGVSIPSTLRYDFITEQFTVLFDLNNTDSTKREAALGASTGSGYRRSYGVGNILEGTSILNTDGVSYTVPSGNSSSRWIYYGAITDSSGGKKHLWAGWKNNNDTVGIAKVVLACDCPAFITPDSLFRKASLVPKDGSATITVPYIIGGGTPYMTIITQPQFGTISQSVAGDNTFTYTNTIPTDAIADTFQVQLSSEIAGDCLASDIYTVQIQLVTGSGTGHHGSGEIYYFVDTTSFSTADADRLKAIRDRIKLDTLAESPAWAGEIYMIPVNDSRFLGYTKSIVDDGVSASLDTDPAWTAVRNLPPSWSGGTNPKSNASVIIMSNASPSIYHDATLAAGFGSTPNIQPTTQYLEDYEEYLDIVNGTEVSAWAQAQAFGGTSPFNDLTIAYYPITTDTTGSNAAAILQGLASYAAKMINPLEYGIRTAVDVSGYLMQGLVPSAINPYEGAITAGGVSVNGLYKQEFNMFLDQPTNNVALNTYLDEMLTENAGGFLDKLNAIVLGDTNGATIPATGVKYEVQLCSNDTVIIEDISGGAALSIGSWYTFYINGSPLSGEILATSVAAADYISIYNVNINGTLPCTLAPQYGNWKVTSCVGSYVFNVKVDFNSNGSVYAGDIILLENNTGSDILDESGVVVWPNSTTLCVTVTDLIAPEATVATVIRATNNSYGDCASCLPSETMTWGLYE
jgi:hypothetical protein